MLVSQATSNNARSINVNYFPLNKQLILLTYIRLYNISILILRIILVAFRKLMMIVRHNIIFSEMIWNWGTFFWKNSLLSCSDKLGYLFNNIVRKTLEHMNSEEKV